jgi:hypothetical protein
VTEFYLGMDVQGLWRTEPVWLEASKDVTFMFSHGRLRTYAKLRPGLVDWVCDSRGFSELSQHGKWTIGAREYATALRRYAREIGRLRWASPQDWMCEDFILTKTGLTVAEHQIRTVESVLLLRELLAGEVHIIPVIQGQNIYEYVEHVWLYRDHGLDLTREPVVGVGSVCRRQASSEIRDIVTTLAGMGLQLHGFGVKTDGIEQYGPLLTSADSFAWSLGARKRLGRCTHGIVKHECNCPMRALTWRREVLAKLTRSAND